MATTGTGQGSAGTGGSNQQRDRRAATENTTSSATAGGNDAARADAGITQTLRDTTYRSIDDQKSRASETLGSLAGAVRGMTQPLRDGGQPQIADYVNKAADGIERWASELRQQDLEDAVRAVEQFARRQPAMFLGLAFGAGIVAARFLKSSNANGGLRRYGGDFDRSPRTSGGMGGGSSLGSTGAGPTSMGTGGLGSSGLGATSSGAGGVSGGATGGRTSVGDTPRLASDIRPAGEVL